MSCTFAETLQGTHSQIIKILDSQLSVLAGIGTTLAGLNFQQNAIRTHLVSTARSMNTQARILTEWDPTFIRLRRYLVRGKQDIVIEGSPGVRFEGRLRSRRLYLNCEGHLPTFCAVESRETTLKVVNSWTWYNVLTGRAQRVG